MKYTFMSNRGDYITVVATDETAARALAMQQLWGELPKSWGEYLGRGLMLKNLPQ